MEGLEQGDTHVPGGTGPGHKRNPGTNLGALPVPQLLQVPGQLPGSLRLPPPPRCWAPPSAAPLDTSLGLSWSLGSQNGGGGRRKLEGTASQLSTATWQLRAEPRGPLASAILWLAGTPVAAHRQPVGACGLQRLAPPLRQLIEEAAWSLGGVQRQASQEEVLTEAPAPALGDGARQGPLPPTRAS